MKPARRPPVPLNAARLQDLALHYVSRFATTRARAAAYLARKIRERGWDDATAPDPAGLAERLADAGYIDDAAFAEARARSHARRGLGERRVDQALYAAGIAEDDRRGADAITAAERAASALRFAERRRLGPYARSRSEDRAVQQKQLAAFVRAGHDMGLARSLLALDPGADVEAWRAEHGGDAD